jgi:hypothetical protein
MHGNAGEYPHQEEWREDITLPIALAKAFVQFDRL